MRQSAGGPRSSWQRPWVQRLSTVLLTAVAGLSVTQHRCVVHAQDFDCTDQSPCDLGESVITGDFSVDCSSDGACENSTMRLDGATLTNAGISCKAPLACADFNLTAMDSDLSTQGFIDCVTETYFNETAMATQDSCEGMTLTMFDSIISLNCTIPNCRMITVNLFGNSELFLFDSSDGDDLLFEDETNLTVNLFGDEASFDIESYNYTWVNVISYSSSPSQSPTSQPTTSPIPDTDGPTNSPTEYPTSNPTFYPTSNPTGNPVANGFQSTTTESPTIMIDDSEEEDDSDEDGDDSIIIKGEISGISYDAIIAGLASFSIVCIIGSACMCWIFRVPPEKTPVRNVSPYAATLPIINNQNSRAGSRTTRGGSRSQANGTVNAPRGVRVSVEMGNYGNTPDYGNNTQRVERAMSNDSEFRMSYDDESDVSD